MSTPKLEPVPKTVPPKQPPSEAITTKATTDVQSRQIPGPTRQQPAAQPERAVPSEQYEDADTQYIFDELTKENEQLKQKFQQLQSENSMLRQESSHLKNDINSYKNRVQQLDDENRQSVLQINNLQKQVELYESRLGRETNVRWGDTDPNSASHLRNDLDALYRKLSAFVNLKRGVEIKLDAMSRLLQQYNCREQGNVVVMAAALQRQIFDIVFQDMRVYLEKGMKAFNENPSEFADLESALHEDLRVVKGEIEKMVEKRRGSDEISKMAPVKIRQQVYAVLSARGFMCEGQQHQFLKYVVRHLISELEKYRVITDEHKKKDQPAILGEIVQEILTIFAFRIQAQEPVPKTRFYDAGSPFDSLYMQSGREDVDVSELEVEICSFPVVAHKKGKEHSIYREAQVVTRRNTQAQNQGRTQVQNPHAQVRVQMQNTQIQQMQSPQVHNPQLQNANMQSPQLQNQIHNQGHSRGN